MKSVDRKKVAVGVVFLLVLLGAVFLIQSSCTDEEGARRTLTASGYKNIEFTGYRWGAGGKDDTYITGFMATAPSGQTVTGVVTRGVWMKGNTIRLD